MRFVPATLIALALLLGSSTASAQWARQVVSNAGTDSGIPAATRLDTSPTTDSLLVDTYSWLKVQVRFVGAGAATNIGFTCEESDDDSVWSQITKTAPDDTNTQFHPLRTTGASVNFTIRVDVAGFVYVRCTFTGAGATATDTLQVVTRRQRGE